MPIYGTTPDATTSSKGKIQLAGDLAGTAASPTVVASSTTVAGKVELATDAETTTGTDTTRAITPANLKAKTDTMYQIVTSSTRPGSPAEGWLIYETDTDYLLRYSGTAWIVISGKVGCTATRATNQVISHNTVTAVTYTAETYDSHGFFSPTSGNFTIPSGMGGVYAVTAFGQWSANPTTTGFTSIGLAGGRIAPINCNQDVLVGAALTLPLAAGETVSYLVYQFTGGNLNFNPSTFHLYRVSL